MSTKENILDLCRRLRFEIAGAPSHLVTLFDSFSAAIVAVPFEEPPWRNEAIDCRRSLLASEAFPGASAKNMIRVDLVDGRRLEGKSAGYCPAVEIWTTEGIRRVDLLELPEDLRQCFEAEMEGKYLVPLREATAIIEKATANSQEMGRKVAEYQEATDRRVADLFDHYSELWADWREAVAEILALQDENTRLRAELEEFRQSRTM